jgi:hypothetical protein
MPHEASIKRLPSWFFAECACGEINPTAILRRGYGFICHNCEGQERGLPEKICSHCIRLKPYEWHHIHGRKVSEETKPWCLNCHKIIHRGRELQAAGK